MASHHQQGGAQGVAQNRIKERMPPSLGHLPPLRLVWSTYNRREGREDEEAALQETEPFVYQEPTPEEEDPDMKVVDLEGEREPVWKSKKAK